MSGRWMPPLLAFALVLAIVPQPAAALPANCTDGLDNDGDGKIDFADPSCDGTEDNERPDCDNEADDDGDTLIDASDSGCRDSLDESEEPDCMDGRDADGDGSQDWPDDPGCSSPWDGSEEESPAFAGLLQQCADPVACVDLRPLPAPCPGMLPPQNLSASSSPLGIQLDWDPPLVGTPAGYTVYRGVGVEATFAEVTTEPIGSTGASTTDFLDSTAEPDAAYVYWVTANGPSSCETAPSNPAAAGFPPDLFHCVAVTPGVVPPLYVAPDCIGP